MAWSLLLALVALTPDAGATRLAVAPLRGKGGAACAHVLSDMFAERVRIVPLEAGVEGLTNWDELAEWIETNGAPEADVVVVGSLNNSSIVLEAYTTHDKKLVGLKSVDTFARCKLSADAHRLLITWLDSVLPQGSTSGSPRPVDVPPPSRTSTHAPSRTHAKVRQKRPPQLKVAEAPPPEWKPFNVSIRGGISIGRRGLSFTGATTSNLRAYDVDLMPMPTLSLEAYPLAATGVWEYLRPFGLAASFSRSVGLSSARVEGGPKLDTIHTEVNAVLLYRWHVPVASLRLDLIPQVGYHFLNFGVRSGAGGTEPDLPDVAYTSISLGIGADVPVLSHVNLFGSGSYLAVLDAGQIFSSTFFAGGKAHGYRVEIGMGYEVVDGFMIEISGNHLSYSLSLNSKETDERVAQSANDSLSGIALGIRIQL